jgi:hypothetical protein
MNSATINQGNLFKKYQKKIIQKTNQEIFNPKSSRKTNKKNKNLIKDEKQNSNGDNGNFGIFDWWKKEGLENPSDPYSQFTEIKVLQDKLESLLAEYKSSHNSLIGKTQQYSTVTGVNNKYSNKYINFTNGTVCYVTNQGIVKLIQNEGTWDSIAGKNGCPAKEVIDIGLPWLPEYANAGTIIPTDPPLLTGSAMSDGEACGNAGQNVYVNQMIKNATEKYIGCYRDKPESRVIDTVPILTVANSYPPQNWEQAWNLPGFTCTTSSIFLGNNNANGAYAAFDKNNGTFWHSEVSPTYGYNRNTGDYEGLVSFEYEKSPGVIDVAHGEWVWIKFDSAKTITQYDIIPRQDAYNYRSPNTWTIMALNPGQRWQVLSQESNIDFTQSGRRFNITSPGNYLVYLIVISKVGNSSSANSGNRYCVQIAEWNLYESSDANFSNEQRAMNYVMGEYNTFETCKQRAMDGGFKYFGLQDVKDDGKAACLLSNDLYRTQIYGEANDRIWIPIWSSGTAGKAAAGVTMSADGRLIITEAGSGSILWTSANNPASCWWGGHVNPDSIQGSYGGNCVGRPVGIDCGRPGNTSYPATGLAGNMNGVLREIALGESGKNANFSASVQQAYQKTGLPGDPAVCCGKMMNYTYQCGGGPFKNGTTDFGGTMNFDCSTEVSECGKFRLELQDDGNMCIYQGENYAAIWCTETNGKPAENNPAWEASKGKYGVPRLTVGQVLGPNEWIGSTYGLMMLVMQQDGNLVLYASKANAGCVVKNDKSYGKAWTNAVYEISSSGIPGNMNKFGYVDSNGVLSEYPESMIKKSNQYNIIPNFDSAGNDFGGMPMQNSNVEQCKTACTTNDNCGGFVFDRTNNNCWLKNNQIYPVGERQPNNNLDLYLRQKTLDNDPSCGKNIAPIDSVSWENYKKSGRNMTKDTICGLAKVAEPGIQATNDLKTQIADIAKQIVDKINSLQGSNAQLNSQMQQMRSNLVGNIDNYKKINDEYSKNKNSYAVNISGILSETDQSVLQQNYSYMFWSILAIGLITIILNLKKK